MTREEKSAHWRAVLEGLALRAVQMLPNAHIAAGINA